MYLQQINGILQSHEVKIKYDCAGGFEKCGQEVMLKLKYAEKNYKDNGGKHICRQCQLKTKNPMKKKEIQEKVKKTCLEKYGTELPLNSEVNIQKRREQFDDKQFKEQWSQKRKETSLKKYGVEHHMKSDISKENQKKSMREKYGVDHPFQSPEIMAKMKANNLVKYGVENVAQLPEVQIKMAKATLEKYGVEHYNQLPKMKEYLRQNCPQWLKENWENGGPMKGITRPEEWNEKQRKTVSERIKSGNWAGGFVSNCRGRYPAKKCKKENPRFLSSLELKLHYFLDHNPEVEWYDYESLAIPYFDQGGKNHLYFPDFQVKFKNDIREHILETKTWKEKDSINVQLKQNAGIDYANQNNMTYTMLYDEDVEVLGIDLELVKTTPGLILY